MEGNGRLARSKGEFDRFVIVAAGSADECRLCCRYAEDLGYLDPAVAQTWRDGFAEIARMLHGLLKPKPEQRTLLSDP